METVCSSRKALPSAIPFAALSATSGVGAYNRLLWKGYLYDADLGCYCLGKRHYDPFALRFLEPDGIPYLDPSVPGGANPYLYCLNDPVTYADQTGRIISVLMIGLIAGAIVGAAVGGTYGGLTAAAQGKTGWEIVGAIGIGIVAGGIMGAGAGVGAAVLTSGIWGFAAYSGIAWGISLGASAGSGALGGLAMDTLSQVMHEGKVNDWQSVGWSVLQGAVINTISMLSTAIGGGAGSSWSANIGLNVVMGFPVSGISFTLDMLRYYVWTSEEEKERRRRPKAILVLPWKA